MHILTRAMILLLFAALSVALLSTGASAADPDAAALRLFDSFVSGYRALNIPDIDLSSEANFRKIPSLQSIIEQEEFFRATGEKLQTVRRKSLSDEVRYLYDGLLYEIDFNCARLKLEKRFRERAVSVPQGGFSRMPDGREWYRLYVRLWASKDITPAEVRSLGKREVARIRGEISAIQRTLGYEGRSPDFYRHLREPAQFITDEKELQGALNQVQDTVFSALGHDFEITDIPRVDIRPVSSPTKDTPPGYYDKGTFYYTFYNNRFPRRSLEWLFIHEAVPGHHYQVQIGRMSKNRPDVRGLFWYPGFSEGWGAYAEDLGKDLGCYRDPYLYLGKWEWDLVRSARLVVDVGIHYEGWTRTEALRWWNENVPGAEEIAEREIDRITRWPAQVISYKAGEEEILKLRKMAENGMGKDFDLRRFHSIVLQRGSIPLPLLHEIVEENLNRRQGH